MGEGGGFLGHFSQGRLSMNRPTAGLSDTIPLGLGESARFARLGSAGSVLAVSPVLVTRRVAGIWYGDGVVDALVLRCIRVKRPDLLSGPSFFAGRRRKKTANERQ
jgi:hypothetical protein